MRTVEAVTTIDHGGRKNNGLWGSVIKINSTNTGKTCCQGHAGDVEAPGSACPTTQEEFRP